MIGKIGQEKLSSSRVAILGCGALGTVAADILARAGVGFLRLIDRDVVEWTNLQRQSLFNEQDAREARAKAEAACDALQRVNSGIVCEPVVSDVNANNITSILSGCDLVIDAADNFAVRFLLNDYSLEQTLPWVHGGCVGTTGQVAFFRGQGRPCFRCLVPEMPPAAAIPTCDTAGVLGSATHAIASLQVTEAIKWLTGNEDAIRPGVFSLDFWTNRNRMIGLPPSLGDSCGACGGGERKFLYGNASGEAEVLCGRLSVQLNPVTASIVNLEEMASRWHSLGEVNSNRFFARIRISESETLTLFRDGRALVDGTDQIWRAKAIYAQLVGG